MIRKIKAISTHDWYVRQQKDIFIKKRDEQHLVARSAFKLQELQEKHGIMKAGQTFIELGAAPGGWSQVLLQHLGPTGFLLALDRSPLQIGIPPKNGLFLRETFAESTFLPLLKSAGFPSEANSGAIHGLVSDMAPSYCGFQERDHFALMNLSSMALAIATKVLPKGAGVFVTKVSQGAMVKQVEDACRAAFSSFYREKPKSSRTQSTEYFIVCKNLK